MFPTYDDLTARMDVMCTLRDLLPTWKLHPPPLSLHGRLDRRTLHFSPDLAMPRSTTPNNFSQGLEFISLKKQAIFWMWNLHIHCRCSEKDKEKYNTIFILTASSIQIHVKRSVTWIMWQSYICSTCQNIAESSVCHHEHHHIKWFKHTNF